MIRVLVFVLVFGIQCALAFADMGTTMIGPCSRNRIGGGPLTDKDRAEDRAYEKECLEKMERGRVEGSRKQEEKARREEEESRKSEESAAQLKWWEERTSLAWWMFGRTDLRAQHVASSTIIAFLVWSAVVIPAIMVFSALVGKWRN